MNVRMLCQLRLKRRMPLDYFFHVFVEVVMRVESQDCVKVRLHELGGEEGDDGDGFPGRDEAHAVSGRIQ